MGEASRRGTFHERKQTAVGRDKDRIERNERIEKAHENAKIIKKILEEDISERERIRLKTMLFMNTAKRSGMSPKEFK